MGKETSMAEAKTPVVQDHDRFDQASTLADGHDPAHDPKLGRIMQENAKLANPLAGMSRDKLLANADEFSESLPRLIYPTCLLFARTINPFY